MTPYAKVHTAIVAPVGRDGSVLKTACEGVGIEARLAHDPASLEDAFEAERADVIVLTQEALRRDVVEVMARSGTKAAWDQLPILLLVDASSNSSKNLDELEDALPDAQLVVLERPLRFPEFQSALEMLCRSRGRQYEVRDLLERERGLRRELNHRVKNILSTVQALYALSARKADDLDEFSASFQGRLTAMSRVHDDLFSKDYGSTDVSKLLRRVLEPYETAAGNLQAHGASVHVSPEAAQDLALCAHELATNAAKHGSLSRSDGRVSLQWRVRGRQFVLEWVESGGPPVTSPGRTGFGIMFLRSSMSRFDGTCELEFRPDGLRAMLEAPLERLQGESR